jgi:hypothetical protein
MTGAGGNCAMPEIDDWRRQGQERYLKGMKLVRKRYSQYREGRDHDHCEFCGAKFMESGGSKTLKEGYTTEDEYRWICKQCFEDFKDEFKWVLADNAV